MKCYFVNGIITIETIAQDRPLDQLKKAIVVTLLTSENLSNTYIFSDKTPPQDGEPYLLNQVVDHDKKAIR